MLRESVFGHEPIVSLDLIAGSGKGPNLFDQVSEKGNKKIEVVKIVINLSYAYFPALFFDDPFEIASKPTNMSSFVP